jgi:hypothetical protein
MRELIYIAHQCGIEIHPEHATLGRFVSFYDEMLPYEEAVREAMRSLIAQISEVEI